MNTNTPAHNENTDEILKRIGKALDAMHLADEVALEAFIQQPLTNEEEALVDRVSKRIQARLEGRPAADPGNCVADAVDANIESELLALHRNAGALTPDQQKKLEELRKKARELAEQRKRKKNEGDSLREPK